MAAVAQRGVQPHLPRPDLKEIENLLHHNGNVHPRRSPAFLDDLRHRVGVFFRLQLLVFFFVASGVRPFISHAALVRRLLIFVIRCVCHTASIHLYSVCGLYRNNMYRISYSPTKNRAAE